MIVRRISNDELYHHGIKGQKWGVRRYQNPDGSLTPAGMKYYNRIKKRDEKRRDIALNSQNRKKVAKYSKYLTDEELQKRTERFKNVDYIRQTPIKQYSEGQKFAIRMAEKAITAAAITTAAVIGAKYFKKHIVNTPIYNATMDSIKAMRDKGEAAVKAGKTIKETTENVAKTAKKVVHDQGEAAVKAAKAAKKVASNTSKMVNNPKEIKARFAAQQAIKRGLSEEVAKNIYRRILNS